MIPAIDLADPRLADALPPGLYRRAVLRMMLAAAAPKATPAPSITTGMPAQPSHHAASCWAAAGIDLLAGCLRTTGAPCSTPDLASRMLLIAGALEQAAAQLDPLALPDGVLPPPPADPADFCSEGGLVADMVRLNLRFLVIHACLRTLPATQVPLALEAVRAALVLTLSVIEPAMTGGLAAFVENVIRTQILPPEPQGTPPRMQPTAPAAPSPGEGKTATGSDAASDSWAAPRPIVAAVPPPTLRRA